MHFRMRSKETTLRTVQPCRPQQIMQSGKLHVAPCFKSETLSLRSCPASFPIGDPTASTRPRGGLVRHRDYCAAPSSLRRTSDDVYRRLRCIRISTALQSCFRWHAVAAHVRVQCIGKGPFRPTPSASPKTAGLSHHRSANCGGWISPPVPPFHFHEW